MFMCRYGVRPSKQSSRTISTEYPLGVVHVLVTMNRISEEEAKVHADDLLTRDFATFESESGTDFDEP